MGYLTGKTAIVTGASRGIGKASSEALAKEGANIYVCCRKENEEFIRWSERLAEENKIEVTPLYFDLSDFDSVEKTFMSIVKEKKNIDILVNNAAVSYGTALSMMPISKIKELFDINFFEQLHITQLISKLMMRKKSGSIINIASVSGLEAFQGNIAYGSSKAALIYATKVISKELAPFGIRVNAVAPGTVKTDMESTRTTEQLSEVINRTSMKRVAEPAEIADAVCWLAGDKASFVTGQVIIVDGGRMNV